MNTAWELFQSATLSLAQNGTIKDRLVDAYVAHLARVDEEDLPREVRDEFRSLARTLKREAPLHKREDPVRATVRKMSNEEAAECASAVVRLFGALPRGIPAVTSRSVPTADVVPLFAAEA